MMQYDRMELGRKAKELGFVRDTYEKVCRLAAILEFMDEDNLLTNSLALKGGTAINLTIFDLPRLSVDIDLDFSRNVERTDMIKDRAEITERISRYMTANGYILSPKSKNYHAMDSFVYEYQNAGGGKDNLKIEINYMLRCHVLPVSKRPVKLPWLEKELLVLSVAPIEIFASKTVALLTRTAPRDLYDMHNMVKYGLFGGLEQEMLRKCAVYYSAIGSENPPEKFAIENISNVSQKKIKTDLNPVLRRAEHFNLEAVQKEVRDYLSEILVPTADEKLFWVNFKNGVYTPELVFDDGNEFANIRKHPMALWKCQVKVNALAEEKEALSN